MNAAATQRLLLELKRIRERLDRLIELQEKPAPKKAPAKKTTRKTPPKPKGTSA